MTNVVSEERFYNERQLKTLLPEMEEERAKHREAILNLPAQDSTGLKLLSRIFDVFMGQFIAFVRHCRGGLSPYAFSYVHAENAPIPGDAHQLAFHYRDMETQTNIPVVQFAVVSLLNHEHYPLHGEVEAAYVEEMGKAILELNGYYHQYLDETHLTDVISSTSYYLPYLAVIMSCYGEVPSFDFTMENAPSALDEREKLFPFEFLFDTEEEDPTMNRMIVRLGQHNDGKEILAVEAMFHLEALKTIALKEASLRKDTPTSPYIH